MKKSRSEIETELKISLSSEDLEKVFSQFSPKSASGKVTHKYYPRAYYDTDQLDLYHAGVSLRVQYKPGKDGKMGSYEQTVKFELSGAAALDKGVLYRKECKDGLSGPKPDMSTVSDPDAAKTLLPFQGMSLRHIFTAAIERRYFNVPVNDSQKSVVELAFDVGDVILQPDGEYHRFYEVEIELKSGDPAAISTMRDRILAAAPSAKVQPLSKSQQGTSLYKSRKPAF